MSEPTMRERLESHFTPEKKEELKTAKELRKAAEKAKRDADPDVIRQRSEAGREGARTNARKKTINQEVLSLWPTLRQPDPQKSRETELPIDDVTLL